MTLPGQTITRRDGGLGLSGDTANVFLYVGPSSLGTVNTIERFSSSTKLRAAKGVGVAVELACFKLDNEGGSVDFLKTGATVAAVTSAVTKTGAGPLITLSGTALIPTVAHAEIAVGGILGAGKFRYTLDNGESYSEDLTIPAGGTYLIPNTGITATFAAGTYVLGEVYSFTTTPATYNATNLSDAWGAALDSDYEWPVIVFTGHSASASAAATLAAAITTLRNQMEATFRYPRVIVGCGEDTAANCLTAFASIQDVCMWPVYGTAQFYVGTRITGWNWPRLPFVAEAARRAARVSPATNPAWVGLKDDQRVNLIKNPSFDEFKEGETLHDAKITAPTTMRGKRGVFLTNALLKSGPSSDYRYWQWGRVVDIASTVIQREQLDFINRSVRTVVEGETDEIGCIDPRDAAILNKDVRDALDNALIKQTTSEGIPGYCSGYSYAVNETNKILTTRQLQSSATLVPLANIEQIATDIGMAQEIG